MQCTRFVEVISGSLLREAYAVTFKLNYVARLDIIDRVTGASPLLSITFLVVAAPTFAHTRLGSGSLLTQFLAYLILRVVD